MVYNLNKIKVSFFLFSSGGGPSACIAMGNKPIGQRAKGNGAKGIGQRAKGNKNPIMLHALYPMPYALCFLLLISCLLSSCSTAPYKQDEDTFAITMVWPSPPDDAKIGLEAVIEKPDDIGIKKGFFGKVFEFLLGETRDRIIKPYGITTDNANRVVVVDTVFKRLHIFDRKDGKYTWIDEFREQTFISPIGVAVDDTDNIYMSDSELNKIFVFTKKGKPLFEISDNIQRPTGIAINKKDSLLYVVNTWAHNISVYDLTGKYLFTFGKRGKENGGFNYPIDIFVDGQGLIYVTDSMNFRIQIFDKKGGFISMFGRHGDGSGFFARPKGVAVDKDGNIYVVDALFDAVQIFDREGHFLLSFGSTGQGNGSFYLPSGIFIDSKNRIYVSDSFNKRIQIFRYLGGEVTNAAKN